MQDFYIFIVALLGAIYYCIIEYYPIIIVILVLLKIGFYIKNRKERLRFYVTLDDSNAIVPKISTVGSVGYDLFSTENVTILSYNRCLVSTGVKMRIPRGYYGRIAPRSSLAINHSIDVGGGVIDPDYRGEVKVILVNNSDEHYDVKIGDKIAQLILEKVLVTEVHVVQELDNTIRGSGGFGSTGKK